MEKIWDISLLRKIPNVPLPYIQVSTPPIFLTFKYRRFETPPTIDQHYTSTDRRSLLMRYDFYLLGFVLFFFLFFCFAYIRFFPAVRGSKTMICQWLLFNILSSHVLENSFQGAGSGEILKKMKELDIVCIYVLECWFV